MSQTRRNFLLTTAYAGAGVAVIRTMKPSRLMAAGNAAPAYAPYLTGMRMVATPATAYRAYQSKVVTNLISPPGSGWIWAGAFRFKRSCYFPPGIKDFQTNLIMPEPCPFLCRKLPRCSIIRPTETRGAATAVVNFPTSMGLFRGQSRAFFRLLQDLAEDAEEARRG